MMRMRRPLMIFRWPYLLNTAFRHVRTNASFACACACGTIERPCGVTDGSNATKKRDSIGTNARRIVLDIKRCISAPRRTIENADYNVRGGCRLELNLIFNTTIILARIG
jgi:hypothetical protein